MLIAFERPEKFCPPKDHRCLLLIAVPTDPLSVPVFFKTARCYAPHAGAILLGSVFPRSYEIRRIVLGDDVQPRLLTLGPLRWPGLPHDIARPLTSHVGWLDLVGPLPHLAQAYGAVEPVEDRQRHRDVSDDRPRPETVEVQLHRMGFCPGLLQRVDRPHR